MAVKRYQASIDCVKAARIRIKNTFENGLPVYMSFSGGKDSIVLAELVIGLISTGEIDPGQLTVQFIDEEAIFPCIESKVKEYRKKFLMLGCKFEWYCLEVKHFNCFNELSNDESFICWDSEKENVWVRRPPSFAIRTHPTLKRRQETYQSFLARRTKDGLQLTGVRVAESVQRLQYTATSFANGKIDYGTQKVNPIYDWKDNDVWKYLLDNHIDIPEIYLFLWQSGTRKNQLRVSQFFSIDTARSLVKMNEYYPDLMDRIIRREPNAYLAALYWDSEMFGRSTSTRREIEAGTKKDYKALLLSALSDIDRNFPNPHHNHVAHEYRKTYMKLAQFVDERGYKELYEGLMAGDPKLRTLRAQYTGIMGRYNDRAKKEVGIDG